MKDDKKPTLDQAERIAYGAWPSEWNVDPSLAAEVLHEEVKRLRKEERSRREMRDEAVQKLMQREIELHQFRANVLAVFDGKGKEWDQGGDPVEAIKSRIESLPLMKETA